jgi:hypothetical protein
MGQEEISYKVSLIKSHINVKKNFYIFILLFILKFTQIEFRKFLTKWVVADDQPFTTPENKHFRQMVKVLNPDAIVPKADTIKKDIMRDFEEEKNKRKILFQVSL